MSWEFGVKSLREGGTAQDREAQMGVTGPIWRFMRGTLVWEMPLLLERDDRPL